MRSRLSIKKWIFLSTIFVICIFATYSFLSNFIMFAPRSRVISAYRSNSAVFEEAAISILEDPGFARLDIVGPINEDYKHMYVDIDSVSPAVRQVAKKHKFREIHKDMGFILFYRERGLMTMQGLLYWEGTRPMEQIIREVGIGTIVHIEGRWYYIRASTI